MDHFDKIHNTLAKMKNWGKICPGILIVDFF